MSHPSLRVLRRAAVAVALLLAAPPVAAAATRPDQHRLTTSHTCAFPFTGESLVGAELSLRDDGTRTDVSVRVIDREITTGLTILLRVVNADTIRARGAAVTTWTTTQGQTASAVLPLNFTTLQGPFSLTDPVVLDGSGSLPAVLAGADIASVRLEELRLSMAVTSGGGPLPLEPIGSPPDYDGDPSTVSVPCALNPANQPRLFGPGAIDRTPPSAPPSIDVRQDEVTWAASTDDVGVAEYEVVRLGQVVASVSERRYAFPMGCGPHTFGVRAVDAAGNRSALTTGTYTVACPNPPEPVANVRLTSTADPMSTLITWDETRPWHHHYEVTWPGGSDRNVFGGPYHLSGLPPLARVCVDVVAVDGIGQKSQSRQLCFQTLDGPPTVPTGLRGENVTLNALTLRWDPSYGDLARYEVYYAHGGSGYDVTVTPSSSPSLKLVNTLQSQWFSVRIRAVDRKGRASAWTDWTPFELLQRPSIAISDVTGTLTLPTLLQSSVAVTGAATLVPNPADYYAEARADFTELTLRTAPVRLRQLTVVPLTAELVLSAGATGQFDIDYESLAGAGSLPLKLRVTNPRLFGAIPISGVSACQSKRLANVALASPSRAIFGYGKRSELRGSFALSDLTGCGGLNSVLSPLTASTGNALALTLDPRVKYD